MLEFLLKSFGKNLLWITAVLGASAPVVVLLLLDRRDRQRRDELSSPPQEEKLLRPPGYSLALKMEKLWDDFTQMLIWIIGSGAIGFLSLFEGFVLFLVPEMRTLRIAFLIVGIACVVFTVRKTFAARVLLRQRRNCQLGLRGEQAVAESLSEVASFGYRVFHDLPGGENWNIDHVVVGPQGVFAIETKARRRRKVPDLQRAHVVNYDADKLAFPTFEDHKAIPQARRNAQWVAEYLTKKTGERVDVAPLVVLPGWYVVCSVADTRGFAAMNATFLKKYLAKQRAMVPPDQVRRIITALEEKCRDIEF